MKRQIILFAILVTSLTCSISANERFDTTKFIIETREFISQSIKSRNQGLAFAIFTNDKIIWKECFGGSTYGQPINDSTLFGIQSISKNFTALAVMYALQDGLLELNVPIIQN